MSGELKFSDIERNLLKKIVRWYYAKYKDKEILQLFKKDRKDTLNREERKYLKDIMLEYHRKTGLGGADLHKIEASILEKLGDDILTTDAEMRLKAQKELEERKKKEEKERKRLEKEQKKKEDAIKKAEEARIKKLLKEQRDREKPKHSIDKTFSDLSELIDE